MTKVSQPENKFLWVANWPALDFVNTRLVQDGETVDLLANGFDFLAWLRAAGFVGQNRAEPRDSRLEKAFRIARGYRSVLHAGVSELVSSGRVPRRTIDTTNRLLSVHSASFHLQTGSDSFQLNREWRLVAPREFCIPIAHSFAELLSKADLSRVRKCSNPDCVLFFYDTSKSGTRSWCSLDICGNRLRVAAFRKRHP